MDKKIGYVVLMSYNDYGDIPAKVVAIADNKEQGIQFVNNSNNMFTSLKQKYAEYSFVKEDHVKLINTKKLNYNETQQQIEIMREDWCKANLTSEEYQLLIDLDYMLENNEWDLIEVPYL